MRREGNQSDAPEEGQLVAPRRREGRGWGPFSGTQLTIIVVAIVVALIPTAAFAAVGTFTSTTATPAVTATNSSTAASAKGVRGIATGTNANARYGVTGNASGVNGIGVQGTGTKYGVFSSGNLGVAGGKTLTCNGCVPVGDLSNAAGRTRAYAYVDDVGTVEAARSRKVAVSHPSAGVYCVTVSNIDPNTIAPVVTVSDSAFTGYVNVAEVTFDASIIGGVCTSGAHFVVFLIRTSGNGGSWTLGDNDFTIVVP